jgi:hypothetical protein
LRIAVHRHGSRSPQAGFLRFPVNPVSATRFQLVFPQPGYLYLTPPVPQPLRPRLRVSIPCLLVRTAAACFHSSTPPRETVRAVNAEGTTPPASFRSQPVSQGNCFIVSILPLLRRRVWDFYFPSCLEQWFLDRTKFESSNGGDVGNLDCLLGKESILSATSKD